MGCAFLAWFLPAVPLAANPESPQPQLTQSSNPAIVRVDVSMLATPGSELVTSDANMQVMKGAGARASERRLFASEDERFRVFAAAYEPLALRLVNWPVDELMVVLEGHVEIADNLGHGRSYGPGDAFMMPRGFNGTWTQQGPLKKIAVTYGLITPGPVALSGPMSPNVPIVNLDGADLRGTENQMQVIEDWDPYLKVIQGKEQRYLELPRFKSGDGELELHVKRFEPTTLDLKNWPIDEFMHILRGHVDITNDAGNHEVFGPGDSFVIPTGFSGTWRQVDTLDMVTAAYTSGPTPTGRDFFYTTVVPKLAENGCPSCHAVGFMHPNVVVYEELLRRLAIGDSALNNAVIYKIANIRSIAADRPEHPGGQRCATIDAEPCLSIRRWWALEFGGNSGTAAPAQ